MVLRLPVASSCAAVHCDIKKTEKGGLFRETHMPPHAPRGLSQTLPEKLRARYCKPRTEPLGAFSDARGRSSDGRALQSHCRGQGFDSPRLHQRQ